MYASFGKRFIAFFIDGILLSIANFILKKILGNFLGSIVNIALGWGYFAYMESSENQATIGKMIMGIKVTDLDGCRISFATATGRYFSKILSSIILMIVYIMAAFTEKKQALHDMIAGTLVVEK